MGGGGGGEKRSEVGGRKEELEVWVGRRVQVRVGREWRSG